jgi:hypothetical protein
MKSALVLILSCAAAAFAADPKPGQTPPQQPEQVKRLASVTWDLGSEQLVWVVQTGTMVNGAFVAASEQKYVITPNDAVMAVAQEKRGFDNDEAAALHHLLDVLSVYCAESVVWWDEGQGTPIPPGSHAQPTQPNGNKKLEKDTEKPVRVGQPEPSAPKYKVPDSDYVARVGK